MFDDGNSFLQLRSLHLQSRRSHAGAAASHFLLNELDELHELRNGIHPEKRKEPAIELERFLAPALPVLGTDDERAFERLLTILGPLAQNWQRVSKKWMKTCALKA